jgi:hypothetical protein
MGNGSEQIVLASVSIDSNGVVTGVAQMNTALGAGETATLGFAKKTQAAGGVVTAFVGRLFNMRAALLVAARALGVVGLVTTAALAIRRLAADVLSSSAAWKRLTSAVEDYYLALVKGEDVAQRTQRHMIDAAKAAGVETTSSLFEQIEKVSTFITEARERLRTLMPGGALALSVKIDLAEANRKLEELIARMEDLGFGRGELLALPTTVVPDVTSTPAPKLLEAAGLGTLPDRTRQLDLLRESVRLLKSEFKETGNLDRFNAGLAGVRAKAVGLHASIEDFQRLGLPRFDVFELAGIPKPEEFNLRVQAIVGALQFLNQHIAEIPIQAFEIGVKNLTGALENMGFSLEQIDEILKKIGITSVEVKDKGLFDLKEAFKDFANSITIDQAKFETFQAVVSGVADAISQAFLEGGVTLKQAVVDILKTLTRLFITYGVAFFALGVVASTPWGAFLGNPTQFFLASGKMFLAAAIAGAAAIALGGRGGGGGREGGGRAPELGAPGGSTRGGPQVFIQVDGSIIGSDPNELARSIEKLIIVGQGDRGE